jgi:hypothetical protein
MTIPRALLTLCSAAGIDAESTIRAESPQRYHLSVERPAAALKGITRAAVEDLIAVCGEALTLTVGLPDARPALEVSAGQAPDLAAGLSWIAARTDALPLELDLALDKDAILDAMHARGPDHHSILFLFCDNLIRYLQQPLSALDGALFASPYQPTLIVVSDTPVRYAGPLLSIADPGVLVVALAHVTPLSDANRDLVDRYHDAAQKRLHWTGVELAHLTPLHASCERLGGALRDLDAALADLQRQLFVLYTANHASRDGTGYRAAYANSERVVELRVAPCMPGDALPAPASHVVRWPYEGTETDRLTLLQNVLARELEGGDPQATYRALYERLDHLMDEAAWHLRMLLDGELDKHFALVQTITTYVADAARGVADKLDAVTKGVSDSLLGTVGVVAVTLLAALVQNDLEQTVLRGAIWAYAAYMLLLQGAYRLGSIGHSYHLLEEETRAQLAVYEAKLGEKRVAAMLAPLRKRRAQFRWWFWGTVVLYALVTLGLAWLGYALPSALAGLGTPIPDPGASPLPAP